MNPEEGELRPQFLDRFGLAVLVESEKDPDLRVELAERRERFEADPDGFRTQYAADSERLRAQILKAKALLPALEIPQRIRKLVAELAAERHVAGHRADLFLERAACSLTALAGRRVVSEEEVLKAAPLALSHRQRDAAPPPPPAKPPKNPNQPEDEEPNENPDEPNAKKGDLDPDQPNDEPNKGEGDEDRSTLDRPGSFHKDREATDSDQADDSRPNPENLNDEGDGDKTPLDYDAVSERVYEIGATFRIRPIGAQKDRLRRRGSGRRSRSLVNQKQGRYVKSGPNDGTGDVALDATIRAAAPYQKTREKPPGLALALKSWDIRSRVREKKMGHHLFFAVDASGSMGARGRMAAAKGAIMSILLDAYQKRDQVALVSFRRGEAVLNLPLTSSVDLAGKLLAEMPTGGRTPLTHGLALAFREIRNVLTKNPLARPIVIFITDGRGNVGWSDPETPKPLLETWALARIMAREKRAKYLVVDTEEHSFLAFNMAARLAEALGAEYFQIDEMKAQTLLDIVRRES
jgi:magnesium chelatase subunit D